MPEPPADLLAAVDDQADARVRADIQAYAKYLTPEAIDSLRASFPGIPPRVNGYEVQKHEPRGADHVLDVRYFARDHSFVVRSRWRQIDGGWMVAHSERLWAEGETRPGLLARLMAALLSPLGRLRSRR